MLQCLLVAARPLHVAELAELLAFDFEAAQETVPKYRTDWRPNDQVQAVLSICSSLITIANDQCSRVVQFSHFSVKEFLMSNRLTSSHGDFSRYQILPRSAHTILAKACLGVLLHLDDHVDSENVKGFPLAEYAAEHWVTHAQFKDVASHVKDGMVSLFDWDKPHFAAWVGIYDIDRPDRTHRELPKTPTPLYYSSLCGFSDLVQSLAIKHPQHVNAFGGQYGFPLRAALFKERFEIAVILLKHGAEQRRSLHEAIADVNIVRLLLNHGADVNFRQDDLRTPLHLAAWYAELEVARVLLEHNADVRSRDNMGKTPLHLLFGGSGRGDGDIPGLARLLLDHGAHVNTQDDDDNTPLHLASDRWMYKCARILLEHGADASAENKMGKTPWYLLFEDIYRDDEDIPHVVRLSLEHGADVNTRVTNEWTMLHAAAYWGRLETARVLLGYGANIGAETDHGETPLHIVSRGEYGSPEDGVGIARLLLNHGVDVHARDKDYDTALHWAAFKGRPEIAGLLLDHGASTNMENEWGETPLHLVSRCKYDTQKDIVNVVRLLLKRGVDVHAQDKNHDTALHSAAFRGRLGIVKVLLDHSSNVDTENDQRDSPLVYGLRGEYCFQEPTLCGTHNVPVHSVLTNAQNKQHNTALHLACYSGRVEIAQMLLEHGANTSTKNEQGETPLHLVTRGNYDYQHQGVSIVLLLLARGVDVDTRKNSMATPLHLAAFRGRLKMTKVLLDHGANPHTKNDQGETPLHLAAFKGRLEIAKVLVSLFNFLKNKIIFRYHRCLLTTVPTWTRRATWARPHYT
jgi:ankyrin repeat protein